MEGNQTADTFIKLKNQATILGNTPQTGLYANIRASTTVGFERANWQIAMKNKQQRSNRYYKGQLVSPFVDIQTFKAYGPGVYLFFVFLWEISILFLIMSLISLMPIIYNYVVGSNLSNVGDSVQVYLGRLTIGNQKGVTLNPTTAQITTSNKNKLFNTIPDIVNSVLFFLFYLYWERKSNRITDDIKKQVKLPSYSTLQILQFPQQATQKEIQSYMNRFGRVRQIAAVKNYSQMISLSKSIYERSLQLKQLRLALGQDQQTNNQKLTQKQKQIEQLYQQLKLAQTNQIGQIIKYYVTYETPAQRQHVLQLFKPYNNRCCKCCSQNPDQNMLLNGFFCIIQGCNEQPGGIIWQNVHITWKTRWIRNLLQALFLITILTCGFLLISLLNILTPPLSNDSLDTSNYTSTSIQNVQNVKIVQSWCLKNIDNITSSSSLTSLCSTFTNRYYTKIALTVLISIAVFVIKFIIRIIVIYLAKFQRYKTHTQQSQDIVINLFVTYTCTTVLIIFLLQANIFQISFKAILNSLLSSQYLKENLGSLAQYNDFNTNWYVDIGYQIWLTWLILALSPHSFMPIVHWLMEKLGQWRGKDQILQKNMQKKIEAQTFQIQDHYANIIMIIFVCLTFSGGIPLLIPISAIGLLTRYLYYKYTFIRFCRIPQTFNESINKKILQILPIALLFHFCFSIWMYGVKELFAFQQSWLSSMVFIYLFQISTSNAAFLRGFMIVFQRLITTWYMTGIALILTGIFIFKTFFFDIVLKMCSSEKQKVPSIILKSDGIEDEKIRSQRSLTTSYKLQSNPDYFQILAIMKPKRPPLIVQQI